MAMDSNVHCILFQYPQVGLGDYRLRGTEEDIAQVRGDMATSIVA